MKPAIMQNMNGKEDARFVPELMLLAVAAGSVLVALAGAVDLMLVWEVEEEFEEVTVVEAVIETAVEGVADEVLEETVVEEALVEEALVEEALVEEALVEELDRLVDVWDFVDDTEEEVTVESIPNRGE